MYVYIYIYIYVCIIMHIYIYIYVSLCIHICIYIYIIPSTTQGLKYLDLRDFRVKGLDWCPDHCRPLGWFHCRPLTCTPVLSRQTFLTLDILTLRNPCQTFCQYLIGFDGFILEHTLSFTFGSVGLKVAGCGCDFHPNKSAIKWILDTL